MRRVSGPEIAVLGPSDADEVAGALARLLPQVSSRAAPLTASRVRLVLGSAATSVLVARLDGQIVGMALLATLTTLAGDTGYVEEVAVDEAARGQHVAAALMGGLIELARQKGLWCLELTTRPSRVAANGLYQSLGFSLRETNCYRLDLSPPVARPDA
jgi:ribosomal protein S18 acetylase RimI-like enzyme